MHNFKFTKDLYTSIYFWIAVGIVGFYLALAFSEIRSIPTTILEALIIGPMVLGAWKVKKDYQSLINSNIFLALLIYWLYSWFSVLWANSDFYHGNGYMIRSYLYSLIFTLACAFCYREFGFERFLKLAQLLYPIASLLAAYSIFYFYYSLDNPLHTRMDPVGRLMERALSTFFYGFFILIGLISIFRSNNKWFSTIFLIPLFLAIALTGSRMAIAATFLSSFVLMFLHNKSATMISFGIIAFLSVLMLLFFPGVAELLMERGLSFRLQIWLDAINKMPGNWLIGHGNDGLSFVNEHTLPGGRVVQFHPHNIFINVIYTGGLIGFALFGFLLFQIAQELKSNTEGTENKFIACLFILNVFILLTDGNNIFPGPGIEFFGLLFPIGLILGVQLRSLDKVKPHPNSTF